MMSSPRILVPCGKCIECAKAKAAQWRFRLFQEINLGGHKNALFLTLTLDPKHYDPEVKPGVYLRLFLDRFRKKYGYSPKHWFIHEYGSDPNGTHRLHFHGLIFDWPGAPQSFGPAGPESKFIRLAAARRFSDRYIAPLWQYGFVYLGDHCSLDTALYITKYISKGYFEHFRNPEIWRYPPHTYCSAGIGIGFLSTVKSVKRRLRYERPRFAIGSVLYTLPGYYVRKLTTFTDGLIYSMFSRPPTFEETVSMDGVVYSDHESYLRAYREKQSQYLRDKLVSPTLSLKYCV